VGSDGIRAEGEYAKGGPVETAARVSDASSPVRYPRLRPGPGRSREEVSSHQRARIYAAMIELAAERGGYDAVTVSKVVRRARVSPRCFYEHFKDKDECFLATYDAIALRSAKRAGDAQVGMRDWRGRLTLAFRAWTGGIASHPKMAQLALIEAFASGPAALVRMRRAEEMFEAMIARSFAGAPDGIAVPPLVIKGIVAGVHRVARARLLAGRAHELPDLADELLEWVLCFRCEAAAVVVRLHDNEFPPPDGRIVRGENRGFGDDDRARILEAVELLAARDGYWQLTVPRIRAAAGVSRKCFDEHFADVRGCFTAALERHTELMRAHAASVAAHAETWPGALHRVLRALCAHIAADPAPSRLVLAELLALGPDGMRYREQLMAGTAETLRTSAPPGQRPSELAAEASVGAVWGLIHHHAANGLADRRTAHRLARRLPSIAPTLSFLAIAPAIGAPRALAAIRGEERRMTTSVLVRPRPPS
jgi:AcrR family transcriptional regulator